MDSSATRRSQAVEVLSASTNLPHLHIPSVVPSAIFMLFLTISILVLRIIITSILIANMKNNHRQLYYC